MKVLRGDAALKALPAYDEIAVAAGAPVTARARWLRTWAECYREEEPIVVLAGGAAAALACRYGRIVAMGHRESDLVRLPSVDDDDAVRVAEAVADLRPVYVRLDQVPAHEPVVEALLRTLPVTRLRAGDGMPRLVVGERDPARHLSRNTRQAVKRAYNKLSGHDVKLGWTSEVAPLVPELSAVHRARDAALGQRSNHDDSRAAAFHRLVLERHEVELLTLRIDGELAAYVAGLVDGRALRVWNNRLNPRWAHVSAGRIANAAAVERVVQDFDELDWMRGEEPYKLSLSTEVVATRTFLAWPSELARAPYVARQVARWAKRRSPALSRAYGVLTGQPKGSGDADAGGL